MVDAKLLVREERQVGARHGRSALDLAGRLPGLMVTAREVAASVMHGVHGRRQSGIGESFWQFRPFMHGETAANIDWRRSARDDRTYVREREMESAQTVLIWIDRSPSMAYVSSLAQVSKLDRALVLGLAAADLLVRGGERAGLVGLLRPMARRAIVEHMGEALLHDERQGGTAMAELPPPVPLPPRSRALFIGDWLSDPGAVGRAIATAAAQGAGGHLVQIVDPVEETFPFTGHVEFTDTDGPARLRVGEAESLRARYLDRLAAHREAVLGACRSRGWSFAVHRTDGPASAAMLGIGAALSADRTRSGG